MSRINTNISSLAAQHAMTRNNSDLSTRLMRLSTGLRINSGKDDPAGLIASQSMRSEMAGIQQAVANSTRAGNVINTAEGALNEISAMLIEVQSLTNEAANTGALSSDEIAANQLQVDAILNSINRISNTTQFNGVKLLNGSLDYTLSSVTGADITGLNVYAAKLPDNGNVQVSVQVVASAQTASLSYSASGIPASGPATVSVAGATGTQTITFAASAHNSAIVAAINQYISSTGVSAAMSGSALRVDSTAFGSNKFVEIKTVSGSFFSGKDYGVDALVNINGTQASVDGLRASVRTSDLDVSIDLAKAFGQQTVNTSSFYIIGGGAKFQLGSSVNTQSQTSLGFQSVATTNLGDNIVGYLSSLASGGANSLVSGNTVNAQKIIDASIGQISRLRGRLGAFEKDILDTNVNSLNVALENVTSAESNIRDSDFATETAALTRAQILVQANTSVLSTANSSPQQILKLLQG